MRVLPDENVPHDLRHFFPGHIVATVAFQSWNGLSNDVLRPLVPTILEALDSLEPKSLVRIPE